MSLLILGQYTLVNSRDEMRNPKGLEFILCTTNKEGILARTTDSSFCNRVSSDLALDRFSRRRKNARFDELCGTFSEPPFCSNLKALLLRSICWLSLDDLMKAGNDGIVLRKLRRGEEKKRRRVDTDLHLTETKGKGTQRERRRKMSR